MDTRGIMINQDAYDALKARQKDNEGLTQVILRLVAELEQHQNQAISVPSKNQYLSVKSRITSSSRIYHKYRSVRTRL